MKAVIQLNKKVLEGWAQNLEEYKNASTILLTECKVKASLSLWPLLTNRWCYGRLVGRSVSRWVDLL